MFVSIDGLDGVGKTTLVKNLARYHGGIATDTPGAVLRPVLNSVLAGLGDHQTARCLFYAASVLVAGQNARELVDSGQFVFMDRYWLSTIAYARARGVSVDLSAVESIVPAPDLSVLVTCDEVERRRRMANRQNTAEDLETYDFKSRATILREMRSASRRTELRPVEIDATHADRTAIVRRVLALMNDR